MATHTFLGENTLTASAAVISVSGIPPTYTDLRCLLSARTLDNTPSFAFDNVSLRLNNATTDFSNIYTRFLGDATQLLSNSSGATGYFGDAPNANAVANTFAVLEVCVSNYSASIDKFIISGSSMISDSTVGYDHSTSMTSLVWSNASAVTEVGFAGADPFTAGTSLYVYGIAKA